MLILLGIAGVLVVAVDVGGNFVLTTEMSANRESIEFAIASVGVFMISAGVGVIRRSHRWLVAGIVLAAVLLAVFAQQTLTQVLGGRELPLFHNSEFTGWHLLLEVTATVVPVFALYTLLRTQWRLDR